MECGRQLNVLTVNGKPTTFVPRDCNRRSFFCGQPHNLSSTQYVFGFIYSEIMAANAKATAQAALFGPLAGLEVIEAACNRMRSELVNLTVFLVLP